MSLITNLKQTFIDGAAQAAHGVGEAAEGLIAFPTVVTQYLTGTTEHFGELAPWSDFGKHFQVSFQDNPVVRFATAFNHTVLGAADLASGHLLYSAAEAMGIQEYTPWFTPADLSARGIARDLTTVAMIFATPAAKAKAYARLGIPEKAVPVSEGVVARELAAGVKQAQQRAAAVLERIYKADDAAFVRAWKNTTPAGQMGALEIPQGMLPVLTQTDFVKMFRQATVTELDLQALAQHADAKVSAAAKQVFVERTNPVPEGYVQISGGAFVAGCLQGQTISPFAMKATPVTNVEWFQVVDGKPRYVTLEWNQTTHAVVVKDIFATPPAFLSPRLNFDAGEIVAQGSQVLVKLLDNPSRAYDAAGRVYSSEKQPVVGVSYFHVQAWLRTQTLEAGGKRVYGLPTDLQFEYVASNAGKFEFGTETGKLRAADGRKLAHFRDTLTAVVDDPLYPAGPFGVQTTGNVWRWIEVNPQETYPYGLRGGSWYNEYPEGLRAAFRRSVNPFSRSDLIGLSPVVLPGLPK